MQMNTIKWLISLAIIGLIACTPAASINDSYGPGFIKINEIMWSENYTKPYPFTVTSGEIVCGSHPKFGREVYFEPEGFIDESYIGTPLNKSAVGALKKSNMSSNVPYSIKEGADFNEAIQAGLNVCDEFEDRLINS